MLELSYGTKRYAAFGVFGLLLFGGSLCIGIYKLRYGWPQPEAPSYVDPIYFWMTAVFQIFGGLVGVFFSYRSAALAGRRIDVSIAPDYLMVSYLNGGRPIAWSRVSQVEINDRAISFQVDGASSDFLPGTSISLDLHDANPATVERFFLSYWQQARDVAMPDQA